MKDEILIYAILISLIFGINIREVKHIATEELIGAFIQAYRKNVHNADIKYYLTK